MTQHELDTAKAKLERAYRVAFDSDPFDHAQKQIELALERVCQGEVFEWQQINDERVLKFSKDDEQGQATGDQEDNADEAEHEIQVVQSVRKADPAQVQLTERQQKFVRLYVNGMAQGRAYQMAGFNPSSRHSADVAASQMLRRPYIARYVRYLQQSTQLMDVMTLAEKRIGLADIWRTPVGQIDENHPLAQEVKRKITTTKDGATFEEVTVKMPSKLEAMKLDAQLAGELNEQPQVNVGFNFGLLNQEPEQAKVIDV